MSIKKKGSLYREVLLRGDDSIKEGEETILAEEKEKL